jgi:hypothetical protein
LLDIITFEEDLSLDELLANSPKASFNPQAEDKEWLDMPSTQCINSKEFG